MRTFLPLCFVSAMLVCAANAAGPQEVGYLKVNVTPDKAGVYMDGEYLGPAARYGSTRTYLVAPGQHQLTIVDPRYEDASATVRVELGKTAKISESLKAKPEPQAPFAMLRVICARNLAAVMVNNRFVGHVDEFNNGVEGLLVSPGTYDVRIDLSGGESLLWQRVTLEVGKTTVVRWD